MEEQIVFGDEMMPITLPDDVQIAPPGLSTTLSAVDDIEATVRQALHEPIGRPLLSETARPDWKVTIAFDDPTVPCFAPVWENPSSIHQALGFETTKTVEEAVKKAQDYHGKDASIVFVKYPILACRQ